MDQHRTAGWGAGRAGEGKEEKEGGGQLGAKPAIIVALHYILSMTCVDHDDSTADDG